MNQQIEQLLNTVQKRQAKISKEQIATDEEIKQIKKIIKDSKKFAKGGIVPEKSFKDYTEEYMDWAGGEGLPRFTRGPEYWFMGDKCGLLWYIVEDKGGHFDDFSDIMDVLGSYSFPHYQYTSTDISQKVFKLLPEEFINSFEK